MVHCNASEVAGANEAAARAESAAARAEQAAQAAEGSAAAASDSERAAADRAAKALDEVRSALTPVVSSTRQRCVLSSPMTLTLRKASAITWRTPLTQMNLRNKVSV